MRAVSERPEQATVVVVEQKRKRYTAQQKLELVRLTYLPGNTVSSVARSYGVVPAKQYAEAIDEIKRLQRLLGQMASDNALLKEAVEIMTGKKWTAR